LWLVSVHSSAGAYKAAEFEMLPPLEEVARCSTDGSELWEIEVIAHELRDVLHGQPFVLGGDLNSALAFDKNYGGRENERLFANLAEAGFVDVRPRHQPAEVQTYFKARTRAYQLDHVYADSLTESRVESWTVLSEVARELGLSDHAPILVALREP
jgi:endonuclease/exonuclease/phosphatase family metal-dependent hydrolase